MAMFMLAFLCLFLWASVYGEIHSGRLRFESLPSKAGGYPPSEDRNRLYSLAVTTDPRFGAVPYHNWYGDSNKYTDYKFVSFEQYVQTIQKTCEQIIGGKRFCEMNALCRYYAATATTGPVCGANDNDVSTQRRDWLQGAMGTPHFHTPTNAQSITVWKNQMVASGSSGGNGEAVRRCDKNDPTEGGVMQFYDNLWLQSLYAYVICYTLHLGGESDPGLPTCSLDGMSCSKGVPITHVTPLKTYVTPSRECHRWTSATECFLSDNCEWDPWAMPANYTSNDIPTQDFDKDKKGACRPIGIENGAIPFAAGAVSYWGSDPGCKDKMNELTCNVANKCNWSRGRCIADASSFKVLVLRAVGCRKQRSYGNVLLPNAMNHSKVKEVNFTVMEDCDNINGTFKNTEECQCPVPVDHGVCTTLVTNKNIAGTLKSSCPADDIEQWEIPRNNELDCTAEVAACLKNPFCTVSRQDRTKPVSCIPVPSSMAHKICKKNSFCNSNSSGCVESPERCLDVNGKVENSNECLCGNKICLAEHYCRAADNECFVVNDCVPGKRPVLKTPYPQLYKGRWQVCSDNADGDDVCPITLTGKNDNATHPLTNAQCGTPNLCDYWDGLQTCPRLSLSSTVIYDPNKKTLVISGEKINTQTIHVRLLPKTLVNNCEQNFPVTSLEPDMSASKTLEYFEAKVQGGTQSTYRNKITYTNVSVPPGVTYFVCIATDVYEIDVLNKLHFDASEKDHSAKAPEMGLPSPVTFPKEEPPQNTIALNMPLLSNVSARIRIVDSITACTGNPTPAANAPASLDFLVPVVNDEDGGLDFVLRTVCGGMPNCKNNYCVHTPTDKVIEHALTETSCGVCTGNSSYTDMMTCGNNVGYDKWTQVGYQWRAAVQYCESFAEATNICEAHNECYKRVVCHPDKSPADATISEPDCQGQEDKRMPTSESCALHRGQSGKCIFYPAGHPQASVDISECKMNTIDSNDDSCDAFSTEQTCSRDPHCKWGSGACSEICAQQMDENSCSTVRDWCFWDASPKACFGTTNIRYPPYKTKAECENNGKEWKDDDTHIASCKRRPGIYSRVDSNGWKLSSGTYKICVDKNFNSSSPNFGNGGSIEIYDLIEQSKTISLITSSGEHRPFNSTLTLRGTQLSKDELEIIIVDRNTNCALAKESKGGLPQKSELLATVSDLGTKAEIKLCSPKMNGCPDLSSLTVGDYKVCASASKTNRTAEVLLQVVEVFGDKWSPGFGPGHRFISESMFVPQASRKATSLPFHFYGKGISSASRIVATSESEKCEKMMEHLMIGPVLTPTISTTGPWEISLTSNHLMSMEPGVYRLCMSLNGTTNFLTGGDATFLVSPAALADEPTDESFLSKDLLFSLGEKLWERCPQTCGDCVKCTDTPNFVDEQGFRCKDWQGLACSNAYSLYGYTLMGEDAVLANCGCACTEKETMGTPALLAHVTDDVSTPKLQCSNCRPGWYKSSHGDSVCTPCPEGNVSGSGASSCIDECPVGTYKTLNGCHDCPAGRTSTEVDAENCSLICPGGTYAAAGDAECKTCPPGTYSEPEQESCALCPAGTENSRHGSNSSAACITCPVGKFAVPGAASCESCSPGTYAAVLGASACRECLPGTYQEATGTANCSVCPSGTATRVKRAISSEGCDKLCDWESITPNMKPRSYSSEINPNPQNKSAFCEGATKLECEGTQSIPGHGANCVFDDTPWNKNHPSCRPNQCNMYTNQPV